MSLAGDIPGSTISLLCVIMFPILLWKQRKGADGLRGAKDKRDNKKEIVNSNELKTNKAGQAEKPELRYR